MKRHLMMLMLTVWIAGVTACDGSPGGPAAAPNAVTDWASIVQPAIHNVSEPLQQLADLVIEMGGDLKWRSQGSGRPTAAAPALVGLA
jgi:hypothetical protein